VSNWISDKAWSAWVFQNLVWPQLCNFIGGGEPIYIETLNTKLAQILDIVAGFDYWQLDDRRGIRGIAHRAQVCPFDYQPFNTFTIRQRRNTGTRTEFEKRRASLENADGGWMYPYFTVQSYVSSKDKDAILRSFAVARTEDVITVIEEWEAMGCLPRGRVWINGTDNASFYVVQWRGVAQHVYTSDSEKIAA